LLPSAAPDASPVTSAQESEIFQAISGEVSSIFSKCKDAVVRVEATDLYGVHEGTGFFIDPAGTIYTQYSVAGRSWDLTVKFADKKYPAQCLVADRRSGTTILKIDASQTPFLPIGRSAELRIASPIVVIGYPMDLPVTPSFGLVGGFDQRIFGRYLPTTHIRASVPVEPGEEGAPLLNAKGEVVGILSAQLDYGAVCLGLPIQAAEKIRSDYLRYSGVRPGWLGVVAEPINGDEDQGTVTVTQVAEDGPAAKSGLKEGDVLIRLGGTPIHRFADLRDASFFLSADQKVPIVVKRGDETLTLEAQAGDPPDTRPPGAKPDDGSLLPRLAMPFAPVQAIQH
jgi:serine protease Do